RTWRSLVPQTSLSRRGGNSGCGSCRNSSTCARRLTVVYLTLHVLSKEGIAISNNVSWGVIFADQKKAIHPTFSRAVYRCTACTCCTLPHQLSKMSCGLREAGRSLKVILCPLVTP